MLVLIFITLWPLVFHNLIYLIIRRNFKHKTRLIYLTSDYFEKISYIKLCTLYTVQCVHCTLYSPFLTDFRPRMILWVECSLLDLNNLATIYFFFCIFHHHFTTCLFSSMGTLNIKHDWFMSSACFSCFLEDCSLCWLEPFRELACPGMAGRGLTSP